MNKVVYLILIFTLFFAKVWAQPAITGVLVPQYMADTTKGINQGPRTPFVCRAKITGLTANATYRYETKAISLYYLNGAIPSFDAPTGTGAGNPIYIHQNGPFTYTSNPSFVNLGGYDSLVANNAGEYEGWFAFEPTGNARFAPGNYIHPRIIINNGVTGNSTSLSYLTITDSVKTLTYGSNGNQASGVYSKSAATEKNFAVLWDNTSGTGRPLSCAIIENDDISFKSAATPTNYPLYYRTYVDSVAGAWGTLIPNNNSNGVRRVEHRQLSNGALVYANTDANGVWPTGNTSTVNPNSGYNALKLDSADVSLVPNPTFIFTNGAYSIAENGGTVTIGIRYSFPAKTAKSVNITLKAGGTATQGTDYSFSNISFTFQPTDTLKTFTISISNDLLIEGNETAFLRLTPVGSNIDLGVDSVTTINIIDDDFPLPVASFTTTRKSVSEWNNTNVSIKLSIPAPTACSLTISAIAGTATAADYNFAPTAVNFNTGDSVKTVTVGINDDMITESSEEFYLQLSAASALTFGNTLDTIIITDNDFPRLPIAQISTVNAVSGVADSLGKKYDEVGVVYGINYRPAGLQFVMRDNSGGITVFKSTGNYGYSVKEGDSIRVLGTVAQFNGLTELNADTIIWIAANRNIKSPTVVNKLAEMNENDLVRINAVQFDVPITTWPTVASNISVHNATDTMVIRLQAANTDILGTAAPLGTFDVIGLVAQFDNTNPYISGYQLFPRISTDIIPTAPPAIVTVDTAAVSANENIGTISMKFKINNVNGMATIVNLNHTGSAQNGTDYNAPLPIISFPASAVNGDSIVVTYTIIDDGIVESNETIIVGINAGFNAKVIGKTKTITIIDNDVLPAKITIDSLPFTVNENAGVVKVKAKISNVNGTAASAAISFGGTAIRGTDYMVTPTVLNFPATAVNGDSIVITYTIIEDALFEPATEIIVTTYTASANAVINGGNIQVIVINDNDPNGINSKAKKSQIKVFPNPSNGTININAENLISALSVTDMLGKEVYHDTPFSMNCKINHLPAGIYVLHLVTADGAANEKIIVR